MAVVLGEDVRDTRLLVVMAGRGLFLAVIRELSLTDRLAFTTPLIGSGSRRMLHLTGSYGCG